MSDLLRSAKARQPHMSHVCLGTDDRVYLVVQFDDGKTESIPYQPAEAEQLAAMLIRGAMLAKGTKLIPA